MDKKRRTIMVSSKEKDLNWFVLDASGKTLGRFASEVAKILRGKHKPTYTPHDDAGDGVIVIKSQEHRTQARNRRAAIDRLGELIRSVLAEQKPRKKTKPSKRSKEQRLTAKRHRGQIKKSRGRIEDD